MTAIAKQPRNVPSQEYLSQAINYQAAQYSQLQNWILTDPSALEYTRWFQNSLKKIDVEVDKIFINICNRIKIDKFSPKKTKKMNENLWDRVRQLRTTSDLTMNAFTSKGIDSLDAMITKMWKNSQTSKPLTSNPLRSSYPSYASESLAAFLPSSIAKQTDEVCLTLAGVPESRAVNVTGLIIKTTNELLNEHSYSINWHRSNCSSFSSPSRNKKITFKISLPIKPVSNHMAEKLTESIDHFLFAIQEGNSLSWMWEFSNKSEDAQSSGSTSSSFSNTSLYSLENFPSERSPETLSLQNSKSTSSSFSSSIPSVQDYFVLGRSSEPLSLQNSKPISYSFSSSIPSVQDYFVLGRSPEPLSLQNSVPISAISRDTSLQPRDTSSIHAGQLQYISSLLRFNRVQEVAEFLKTTNQKIEFVLESDFIQKAPCVMTIGQRVYYHLYLILHLENPETVRADDPLFISKAFQNKDGCRSTPDQQRRAIERTYIELAMENMRQLNQNSNFDCFEEYEDSINDIRKNIVFLDSFKMTIDGMNLGNYLEEKGNLGNANYGFQSRLKTGLTALTQQLLHSWKYI